MRRSFIYLFILMLLGTASTAFAQNGEIYGMVTDESNNPFPGVIIKVTQGGLSKGGTTSEDDGSYSIKPLQAGTYDIEFSSMSYGKKTFTGVVVSNGGQTRINNKMLPAKSNDITEVVVKAKPPVVGVVKVITGEEVARAATPDLTNLASTGANVYQNRNGGGLSIRGGRGNETVYMVDGVMIQGAFNPPQNTVSQLQVFSSGIPANLGDATGGVVSVTTKGPSSTLKGNSRFQHSVDGYNQNLLNTTITGPIISRTKDGIKRPILGFLAGIDYQYDQDDNPTFTKNPVLKGDVLKSLQDNPLTLINTTNGTQLISSTSKVKQDDFVMQKRQINNASTTVRLNGKLDYAVNNNINVTLGGNFNYNSGQGYSRANSYFAPENSPVSTSYDTRGFLRFRQSFKNSTSTDSNKRAIVSNAFYTLQLDYQIINGQTQSSQFGRNLFDYGYVGKFTQSRVPVYSSGIDAASGRQAVLLRTLDAVNGITFEASDKNPILANYTKAVYQNRDVLGAGLFDPSGVQRYGGMMNGDFPLAAVQVQNVGLTNIGAGMTGYSYSSFNQLGLHADASFDFKPGKTTHAIQFGLYYEQRSSSSYAASINPSGAGNTSLWNLMYQSVNRHIGALDLDNPIFIHNGVQYTKAQVDAGAFFGPTDTIIYNRLNVASTQSAFDKNLRNKLGAGANDFLDIYSVDPSQLSLGMFSADELLNQGSGFVAYRGYDYTGKKLNGQVNFNDFFTAKDANGNLSRPIGAFNPNYIAGYIMDKFRFQDMTFNFGVRVDRYDNNTKVLKDPYSLYELNTKGNVSGSRNLDLGKHPDNIGDNYAVYVNNNQSTTPTIIGYRNGDKWYNTYGVEIPDPSVLKEKNGGSDPQPYLTTDGKVNIADSKFDPNRSFTDYKPQVTLSPRFSFEFPIRGDQALFYAHYDILVQRPKEGNFASPLDYLYLQQNTGTAIGNPDLKPQKTFDYELGYQQRVSNNSGIGISAFYRERKDMIQYRPYLYAWPRTYYTYGNRDFSTVKGFAFTYNYQKLSGAKIPLDMSLAYTLQFADGTGSSATSGSGVLNNFISAGLPNLRYVAPLSVDSRHIINLTLNYSYDKGEGPTVNGKHILQYFNANMILRARSGEPYTTYQNVVGNSIQGGLNGTRLNWHFGIDLRFDKSFGFNGFGKRKMNAEGELSLEKSKYLFTAFAYFSNIFNIKDVLGVYPYTSRPDDDGYATSPTGQQYFNATNSPQTLQMLYSMYVNNPGFYNGPRRATVGVTFAF